MNRSNFRKFGATLVGATSLGLSLSAANTPAATQPNVLLIILEDWGPYLGCYGHKEMFTPNLDTFAAEGVRFNQCYTTAPVCSVARSSLMTGLYQYVTHSEQHRTAGPDKQPLPAGVKSLPELFRDAGYYTALGCGYHDKVDLNFKFDVKSIYAGKDWNGRRPDQPFFAHLTLGSTHRFWKHDPAHPVDPAKVFLPAWYPDTPLTRADWAMGLESAQISDREFGEIVARLKREGLYDNTIIVVTSDHGIALPRGKQFLYDEGLHLPLIIRYPHGVPANTVRDDLVANIDLVPTILGRAGLPAPAYLQGRNLFDASQPEPKYLFAGRDKMDNTHDAIRSVRTKEFRYILNLMPERAYCQFNYYKERQYPGLALMNILHMENKLPPEQDAFMKNTKPEEELYDLKNDPDEVHNLAGNPEYAGQLAEMRAGLAKLRQVAGDPGITAEFRAGGDTAQYPTRTLAEWQEILKLWEPFVMNGGDIPKIKDPFAPPAPAKTAKPAGQKKNNAASSEE